MFSGNETWTQEILTVLVTGQLCRLTAEVYYTEALTSYWLLPCVYTWFEKCSCLVTFCCVEPQYPMAKWTFLGMAPNATYLIHTNTSSTYVARLFAVTFRSEFECILPKSFLRCFRHLEDSWQIRSTVAQLFSELHAFLYKFPQFAVFDSAVRSVGCNHSL